MFYVGLDLGQRSEHTALAILEAPVYANRLIWVLDDDSKNSHPEAGWVPAGRVQWGDWEYVSYARPADRQTYAIRHLERFPLGTSYPAIVDRVVALMNAQPLAHRSGLFVDSTGVGRPAIEALRAAGLDPYSFTMTGGDVVVRQGKEWRVPKRDLATTVQVLLQERRLQFAAGMPLLDTLRAELQAFEVKLTPQTTDPQALAWREGRNDDLVLAVALCCWVVEADPPVVSRPWTAKDLAAFASWRG